MVLYKFTQLPAYLLTLPFRRS